MPAELIATLQPDRRVPSTPRATPSSRRATPPEAQPGMPSVSPSALHAQALGLWKTGREREAIAAFKQFLLAYPKHKQAASAQYYLGLAYEDLREYPQAATELGAVAENHPGSTMFAAAALLRQADIYEAHLDDAVRAEGRNEPAGFCVERDEAVAGRHVQNALLSTVRPVGEAAAG